MASCTSKPLGSLQGNPACNWWTARLLYTFSVTLLQQGVGTSSARGEEHSLREVTLHGDEVSDVCGADMEPACTALCLLAPCCRPASVTACYRAPEVSCRPEFHERAQPGKQEPSYVGALAHALVKLGTSQSKPKI